jgi:hypothetical protein
MFRLHSVYFSNEAVNGVLRNAGSRVHQRNVREEAGITLRQWLGIRELCVYAILSVGGYLRPRPAPVLEDALRAAFSNLDRELAALLDGSYPQVPPGDCWTKSRRLPFTRGLRPSHGIHVASEVCG